MRIIQFAEDGSAKMLSCDELSLEILGPVTTQRASHVEPAGPLRRILFRALRFAFGERGRVAEWTRRMPGPWMVRIVGGGPEFRHASRDACIAWEIDHLQSQLTKTEP